MPNATIDSRWAEWLFRDLRLINAFRKASRGVVDDRLRLYPQDLMPIRFSMPKPLKEQTSIVERLHTMHSAILSEKEALKKLRSTKTALMQDLLSGEKRVTPLLEPAVTT